MNMVQQAIPPLILASESPRRQQLLAGLGLRFETQASQISEDVPGHNSPEQVVKELSLRKAMAVAKERMEGLVIGSDTIVVHNQQILGKPQDDADAFRMLLDLQGKTHEVYTGLAVVNAATQEYKLGYQATKVTMCSLSEERIKQYINSQEPLDKAGAYAIQGLGATLIENIEGDYFTVVGLPLRLTAQFLREFGVDILAKDKEE